MPNRLNNWAYWQVCDTLQPAHTSSPSQMAQGSLAGEDTFVAQYVTAVDAADVGKTDSFWMLLETGSTNWEYDLVVEIFRSHVTSCAVLPRAASEIITLIRNYILGPHVMLEASPDTPPILPATSSIHPQLYRLLTPDTPQPAVVTAERPHGGDFEIRCQWDGCHGYLPGTSIAILNRHLLQYHFADTEAEWKLSTDRIRCQWEGCGRPLFKRMIAKHVRITHLQCGKVRCQHPGCNFATFSRKDALTRHVQAMHGAGIRADNGTAGGVHYTMGEYPLARYESSVGMWGIQG
ncbi:uncharacterized protein B0H18DRAFT_1102089 [Fomitopsis serialis]|uniref:uncharacterized protein n=1 Tax=Fomitopsis serialis TaxID=139415 RepID=UPI0020079A98|nr:uncharacterized protein B0H18DRAFT_1102089 [Neoantrodia serialis]KAH9933468.1 hypothetical protein B0H18DRAFT_1102089 [Neoantrodia serialis]